MEEQVGLAVFNDFRHRAAHSRNPELAFHRYFELRECLLDAALLVAQDEKIRALYLAHGFSENDVIALPKAEQLGSNLAWVISLAHYAMASVSDTDRFEVERAPLVGARPPTCIACDGRSEPFRESN